MPRLLGWDDFEVILAIAEAGSLSGAARMLEVNHATIFRRLKAIESRTTTRLFERTSGGYLPTTAGSALAERARHMAAEVAHAERQLLGFDASLTGTLRITTTEALLGHLLMPLLADFNQAHPGITLEVTTTSQLHNLSRRDADMALRPTRHPPETLVGKQVGEIEQAIYVAQAMKVERTTPWVGPDATMGYHALERWMRQQGVDNLTVFRSDTTIGMFDAITAGLGQGVLPCYLGDSTSALVRRQAPIAALSTGLWLLTHPDMRRVASARTLFHYLAAALSERMVKESTG